MAAVWLTVPLQKCPKWGSWGLYSLHWISTHHWHQASLSEISFPPVPLDSLELWTLSSAWTLRCFAHTLAHPLGHHTLAAPNFGLFWLLFWLLCFDFCSNGMPPIPYLAAISSPGTMTACPSSLSNQTPGPALLLPCVWLVSDLRDYLTSLIAGHPGISHQHSV